MTSPHLAIQNLPSLKWRGREWLHYDTAGFDFKHEQAERRYPYIDGAAHEWVGRDPLTLPVKLYFLNSLRRGAFPDEWELWREALLDGTPGTLEHPLLGKMDAVVLQGGVQLVAQATAGITVDVTWQPTILKPSQAEKFAGIEDLGSYAAQADIEAAAWGIPYPDGARTDSLFDLFEQIEGMAQAMQFGAIGLINQAKGILATMINFAVAMPVHTSWAFIACAQQLYGGLSDMAATLGVGARATATISYPSDTTLDEVAAAVGNTVGDIMGLNLALLRAPLVPARTKILYYT